jgi:hypothetical protein
VLGFVMLIILFGPLGILIHILFTTCEPYQKVVILRPANHKAECAKQALGLIVIFLIALLLMSLSGVPFSVLLHRLE